MINKKKMCIFDLDGTIDLTDSTLSARILKMSETGIEFVTATGRTNSYVRETCKKHNIVPPRYIIADNGGTIYDCREKIYMQRTSLTLETRTSIIEEYIRLGGNLEEVRYTDGDNVYAAEDRTVREYYLEDNIVEYKTVEELLKEMLREGSDITKITLAGNKRLINQIVKFIKQNGVKCWTDIGATKFPKKSRKNYRLDIMQNEVSKGEAVRILTEHTEITEFTCIGNGLNDFSMFKFALDLAMPVIIVKNFENGKITEESEEVIRKVNEYAKEVERQDKVSLKNFPIDISAVKFDEQEMKVVTDFAKSGKTRRADFMRRMKITPAKVNQKIQQASGIRNRVQNRGR